MAAGLPLWPGAPLLRQPGLLGLPQEDHVDANLSADANSTCIGHNQNSPPHIVPIPDLPDAGLQELATLPVCRHERKTTKSINLTHTLNKTYIIHVYICSLRRMKIDHFQKTVFKILAMGVNDTIWS